MDEEYDYLGKTKKRRHDGCSSGAGRTEGHDSTIAGGGGGRLGDGVGSLPSKEAMASRGLEAKVDMATHGQTSWALTSLGAWREKSLGSSGRGKSAEFVKSRQREVRRAMMLGAAGATAAAATARAEGSVGAGLSGADDIAVG